MQNFRHPLQDELLNEFSRKGKFSGEVLFDKGTRYLYSTDASIYQVEPIGVLIPKHPEDLVSAVETLARAKVPILARGAGSSLAGQAIGPAVIIDCTKYLNKCLEINPEEHWAIVEPGHILSNLNRQAAKFGLQFGPDPASAERASMGGCISNNATGAHSILYGMAADHVISLDMLFADASQANVRALAVAEAQRLHGDTAYHKFVQASLHIHEHLSALIVQHWPKTWRRASGYNLNYLIPWSPSRPPMWYLDGESPYPPYDPGVLALPAIIAGAEGTLGVIQQAKVNLVARPKHSILGVVAYASIISACEDVERILALRPAAIELIPRSIIHLARSVPGFASLVSVFDSLREDQVDPAAILVTEFSGENPLDLREKIKGLASRVLVAQSSADQKKIWDVRKVGLGILMSRPGQPKPVAFIEDLAVPIGHLGLFIHELEKILNAHGTTAEFYAHASAGCLHIRPILNLNDIDDQRNLRSIAEQAVALITKLGGAVSGEHGDGYARSGWNQQLFGKELYKEFINLKRSLDPENLMNPGKIVGAPPFDGNLRTGILQDMRWTPTLDFRGKAKDGLSDAVELCNGAAVCKKSDGLMCPSFQAIGDEMHATRGRANLLRAMIFGHFDDDKTAESLVAQALDLCLACKGCKAECPSSVDMAKLKYEFLSRYYEKHSRMLRDYLFAYIGKIARLGYPVRKVANFLLKSKVVQKVVQPRLGISEHRHIPVYASRSFTVQVSGEGKAQAERERVFFLLDDFHQYYYPGPALAGFRLLQESGQAITVLPLIGAGRTLISKGFLAAAQAHLMKLIHWLRRNDPEGTIPVVGMDPSEIYTLCDELRDLIPGDAYARELSQRTWTIEEYLLRPGARGERRFAPHVEPSNSGKEVLLHGHCYQKAQPPRPDAFPAGTAAAAELLTLAGFSVKTLDTGCCGMAGAFGYEREHYHLSQAIGSLKLFPALADRGEALVAVCGISCKTQVEDALEIKAFHPLELALMAVRSSQ